MGTFIYQESLRTFNQDIFNGVLTKKLDEALKKYNSFISSFSFKPLFFNSNILIIGFKEEVSMFVAREKSF